MKKIIIILSIICCSSLQMAQAQHKVHLQVSAGSGYRYFQYEIDNYHLASQVAYIGRLGLRYGLLELGGEYNGEISPTTFRFLDFNTSEERFLEKHKQTYYGGYIGINTLKKWQGVGLILRAGVGLNNMTRQIVLANDREYLNKELDQVVEYRGQIGLSIKIAKHFALNLEGVCSMMDRNEKDFASDLHNGDSNKFTIMSYGGLGMLVFQL